MTTSNNVNVIAKKAAKLATWPETKKFNSDLDLMRLSLYLHTMLEAPQISVAVSLDEFKAAKRGWLQKQRELIDAQFAELDTEKPASSKNVIKPLSVVQPQQELLPFDHPEFKITQRYVKPHVRKFLESVQVGQDMLARDVLDALNPPDKDKKISEWRNAISSALNNLVSSGRVSSRDSGAGRQKIYKKTNVP